MSTHRTTDKRITERKSRIALLAMAVLVLWAGASLAADAVPDLTGTWQGTIQSVGSGMRTHGEPTDKPAFASVDLTIRIDRQQGRVFYGIKQSKRASEAVVGVIRPDNTVYFADQDGYQVGNLLAPDEMEQVYLEAGLKSRVAGYIVYKRVKVK
jgi:hypothetical protein